MNGGWLGIIVFIGGLLKIVKLIFSWNSPACIAMYARVFIQAMFISTSLTPCWHTISPNHPYSSWDYS